MKTFGKQYESRKKLQLKLSGKSPQTEIRRISEKLSERLTEEKRQIVNLASEKGVSNWLNVLLVTKYGFILKNLEFQNGLHLRYGNVPR